MFRNLVLSVILAILFTWFALANSQIVTVSLFLWRLTLSLSLVILICILLGVVITGLIAAGEQAKMFNRIKDLEGQIKREETAVKKEEKKK